MIARARSVTSYRFAHNGALQIAFVVTFLLALLLLLFVRALARELNHDEHQFIAPAALLLRAGMLPYRDYPFFHMPNLVFVFAALFSTTSHLFLTARCFNAFCAALLLLLFFASAGRRFSALPDKRWLIALAFVLLLSLNPFFRFTAGRAWNHDLAVLASVGGFTALLRATESERGWLWLGSAGALLGIAIGTRLSFAPLVAPFALTTLLFPVSGHRRILCLTIFLLAVGIALLPSGLLFFFAPSQFLFGNFTYNASLDRLYRQSTGLGGITFLIKLAFPLQQLLKSPCDLALVAGFIYFALRPWWRAGWRNVAAHRESAVLLLMLPFLFIGSWAPAVSHRQYYYPFVPFLLLGNISGIAREARWRARTSWLMAAMIVASLLESIPDLSYTNIILHPTKWPVVTVHEKAAQMQALLHKGRVLTLAPMFPLEANLDIYQELASAPFVWRTASLVDEKTRAAFDILDPATLDRALQAKPPAAILTGFEHHEFEEPLLTYARTHGYSPQHLQERGNLWLAPVAGSGGSN